ncbi:MAG: hypothetical protein EOP82_18320 [Variovorax sp.]|nr:MAG: hypothetical protein EOP82_18320 [Variovorax sp.]
MKLLEMPAAQRAAPSIIHALSIDARGQEVLQGLSFEESRFFVACMQKTPSDPAACDRFAALSVRHEAARLRLARADDESTGDEPWAPPPVTHKF